MDKTLWGAGPWQMEPDQLEFEYKGFKCELKRNHVGCWCGYVGIPKDNPILADIDDINDEDYMNMDYDNIPLDVHGGLTYGKLVEDLYWVGFDCAHLGDYWPKSLEDRARMNEVLKSETISNPAIVQALKNFLEGSSLRIDDTSSYKDMDFAIGECKSMVDQIIAKVAK
jgi:hypothetical protein